MVANSDWEGYLACLCRFPNESNEAAVDRVLAKLDTTLTGPPVYQQALAFIERQSYNDVAVTARVFNESALGVTIDQAGLAPEMVELYHERLCAQAGRREASDLARRLTSIATGKSTETIEAVLASVDTRAVASSAAMSVGEQTALGTQLYRERVEQLASGKPRVQFPWLILNTWVPFIYPDDLILLTGQSKTGKSSAAHQVAMHNAPALKVLYFHNEDNPLKLYLRRTAQSQYNLDPTLLGATRAGTLSYRELLSTSVKDASFLQRVEDANAYVLRHLADNITYVYCAGWTAEQIVAEWRRLKRAQGADLVIVDYLNKIESYDKIRTIGSLAGAMEYNVELIKRECGRKGAMTPAVLVQQENEEGTVRDTRSSYIKSQVHISFARDDDPQGMGLTGHIAVLRANDGETGVVPARFVPDYMLWVV